MRYEYEEAAAYTRIAVKTAQGVSKYVIGPAIHDVLSSGGMWVATTAGRAVMGGLMRPPDTTASHINHVVQIPTEQTSIITEPIPPTLRLVDALPPERNIDSPAPLQPYEDLVA